MYERFSDRARRVMQLATQEAQLLNHEWIGTELGKKAGRAPHFVSGGSRVVGGQVAGAPRVGAVGPARSRGMTQLTEAEIAALAQQRR